MNAIEDEFSDCFGEFAVLNGGLDGDELEEPLPFNVVLFLLQGLEVGAAPARRRSSGQGKKRGELRPVFRPLTLPGRTGSGSASASWHPGPDKCYGEESRSLRRQRHSSRF
jgi:hypothetical protein